MNWHSALPTRPPPLHQILTPSMAQVDDGTEGSFGKEIELRGQFEACACASEREYVNDTAAIEDFMSSLQSGWEGARRRAVSLVPPPPAAEPPSPTTARSRLHPISRPRGAAPGLRDAADDGGEVLPERGLAICLCFEGGSGTISTVQVRASAARPARTRSAGACARSSGRDRRRDMRVSPGRLGAAPRRWPLAEPVPTPPPRRRPRASRSPRARQASAKNGIPVLVIQARPLLSRSSPHQRVIGQLLPPPLLSTAT
jgi:hypothetical protein